jgi:HK97 gp10 family phage protein
MTMVVNASALKDLLEGDHGPVSAWLLRKAIDVETAAKRLCPVDTGRLRGSITHVTGIDNGEQVAYVGSNVEYAIYQELGTYKMAAQPYLRPALQSVMGGISQESLAQSMGQPE